MVVIFWAAACLVAYTYLGYPAFLWLRSLVSNHQVAKSTRLATVSVVVPVHNEERFVARKVANLLHSSYPRELLEIIFVCDGCTDGSTTLLRDLEAQGVLRLFELDRCGKAEALNRGVEAAKGEIVVFTDARQEIGRNAIAKLVRDFADETVGCVSGALRLGLSGRESKLSGELLKWNFENRLRNLEGKNGGVIGALGALYAIRRSLMVRLPSGLILDDVFLPMSILRSGKRVVFEPEAEAWDDIALPFSAEFRRKIRTLTGNYQLLRLAPWTLDPTKRYFIPFLSHKIFRLIVPFALIALFIVTVKVEGVLFTTALVLQLSFYVAALAALISPPQGILFRICEVPFRFVMLNVAAMIALTRAFTSRRDKWSGA